jgi:hypothetical protein
MPFYMGLLRQCESRLNRVNLDYGKHIQHTPDMQHREHIHLQPFPKLWKMSKMCVDFFTKIAASKKMKKKKCKWNITQKQEDWHGSDNAAITNEFSKSFFRHKSILYWQIPN